MSRQLGLTGPGAAALYGLDGFRDRTWPDLWCAPITGKSGDRIVRTRDWSPPDRLGDVAVCSIQMVLRHLNAAPHDLRDVGDGYAETRAVQLFRSWGLRAWRQVPILKNGRIVFRADYVVPFRAQRRPDLIRPSLGLLVEIDSREFHAEHCSEPNRTCAIGGSAGAQGSCGPGWSSLVTRLIVGLVGFEPTASTSRTWRASQAALQPVVTAKPA